MLPVLALLLVLSLSLVIVRVATVGLAMTGLSKDLAHFQAVSAFTGSGFTTRESEEIVNHPLRRRIAIHLMLLGHAGIAVAISTVIVSFLNTGGSGWSNLTWVRIGVLAVGILLLWLFASSTYVEQAMWRITRWTLKRLAHIELHDYTRLLRLSGDFVVSVLEIQPEDWLAGRTLAESQLAREGVLVLGIEKHEGTYLGAPRASVQMEAGDRVTLYGQQSSLDDLDTRRADMVGNLHHVMAVTRQLDALEEEEKLAASRRRESPHPDRPDE